MLNVLVFHGFIMVLCDFSPLFEVRLEVFGLIFGALAAQEGPRLPLGLVRAWCDHAGRPVPCWVCRSQPLHPTFRRISVHVVCIAYIYIHDFIMIIHMLYRCTLFYYDYTNVMYIYIYMILL